MLIEITEDKVSHFARELFGMRLETKGGLRYVCFSHSGTIILPNPKLTLQGCRLSIIPLTFDIGTANAIMDNSVYQEDIQQCRDCTDSLSMVISRQADEGAVISVSLGLFGATCIG